MRKAPIIFSKICANLNQCAQRVLQHRESLFLLADDHDDRQYYDWSTKSHVIIFAYHRLLFVAFTSQLLINYHFYYLKMVRKNRGPCSIRNCSGQVTRFRQFTSLAYEKAQKKGTYESYNYLRIGQQLCHTHYLNIVECDRNQKSETPLLLETDKENLASSKY